MRQAAKEHKCGIECMLEVVQCRATLWRCLGGGGATTDSSGESGEQFALNLKWEEKPSTEDVLDQRKLGIGALFYITR